MTNIRKEKIRTTVEYLKELICIETTELNGFKLLPSEYKKAQRPPASDEKRRTLNGGDFLEGTDTHFWISKKMKTPKAPFDEARLYFDLKTGRENRWDATNPQALVYLNGHAVQGLDIHHTDIRLEFDTEYDMDLYLYTGMEEGKFCFIPTLKTIDTRIEKLYYDMSVPYECLACLDENSEEWVTVCKFLELTCNLLDLRVPYDDAFYESINRAQQFIEEEFYRKKCGKSDVSVSCIGHTHIDVAWKWTLAQTEEKAQRSFATALRLMDEYDDFIFMSSQPQLYQYVKDNEPEIYERIVKYAREGRWEPEGAMWLEADCNLSSGESLIRQIIKGKKFFLEEFGKDCKILWLPDVFGYSAALPQILKKTGVEKFVTSKISWNETNKLPYDAFIWEGLDGSEIFTVFITAQDYKFGDEAENHTTYVGDITPGFVVGTRRRFQQKEYTNTGMIPFGYGDGGGGATREMVEKHRRLKRGIPGIPKTVIEPVTQYLKKTEDDFRKNAKELKKTPRWVGELYLEFHRGTYTSVAKNKKNNRKSEFAAYTAEQLSVISGILNGNAYPKRELDECWKLILLNQFHDIIPGSSIKEVYIDSDLQYAHIQKKLGEITEAQLSHIADGIDREKGIVVYNPNSFVMSSNVFYNGKCCYADNVPPMGWRCFKTLPAENTIKVTKKSIESNFYKIVFDDHLNIVSLFDKENNREIIKKSCAGNSLEAFEDLPYQFDNWELSPYYKQKKWLITDVSEVMPINDGVRAGLYIKRSFLNSITEQKIYVYENSRRIDFETEIDWKEKHIVLKAAFPFNIHSDVADYETQFGYIQRSTHENTSYDAAKFEVCAHKYADISEDDYGVAILNDCKYGYNTEGSTMKLTLLKCGTDPNPDADREKHSFKYCIYPHAGNHKNGGVIQAGYEFNNPLTAFKANGDGKIDERFSLISCNKENIIIETVKRAENTDDIVIRAYEAYNRRNDVTFTFGFKVREAYLCDMLENKVVKLPVFDNSVDVEISNFEIVTILVKI